LLAGVRALGLPWRIEGFTVSRSVEEVRQRVQSLAQGALRRLCLPQLINPQDVIVHGGFVGPGYGIPTPEGAEAIRLAARCEGIFLDPTYTGKALAGFMAHVRSGRFSRDETVIFLHTGGEPALFVGEGSWLYA
jgi:1-aminocyclopropane-1-carboxylate deaminase/D-cysteine desulfhydrase-like pyridoxal-dependent ACC family enzyme